MTLLLVTEDFPPRLGGMATWSSEVAGALAGMGWDVHVLARGPRDQPPSLPEDAPYQLCTMDGRDWPTWRGWYTRSAVGRFLKEHPETRGVVCADWYLGLGAAPHRHRVGGRVAVAAHGQEVDRVTRGIELWRLRRSFRRAGAAVAVSSYTADLLRARDIADERIHVVNGGVDLVRFTPGSPDPGLRDRFGLCEGPVILTLARLVRRKGQDVLIQAMPGVLQRAPGAQLLIVGEGPCEGELRLLAEGLGVSDSVIFGGPVENEKVPAVYRLGDVYAMLSRRLPGTRDVEGFGLTFLEASASGLPVVAGRSGGVPDAVEDGLTGYLVDPTSPEEAAAALVFLLQDPGRATAMGRAGRERARERFTWEDTARGVLETLGLG
ncbi:MAG: glycosyltransferase family 4 protein [bacterium]